MLISTSVGVRSGSDSSNSPLDWSGISNLFRQWRIFWHMMCTVYDQMSVGWPTEVFEIKRLVWGYSAGNWEITVWMLSSYSELDPNVRSQIRSRYIVWKSNFTTSLVVKCTFLISAHLKNKNEDDSEIWYARCSRLWYATWCGFLYVLILYFLRTF